jgi:hypothetical protein
LHRKGYLRDALSKHRTKMLELIKARVWREPRL